VLPCAPKRASYINSKDEIHSVQTIATDMLFSARATAEQPIAGVELLVQYGISAESRTAVTRLSLIAKFAFCAMSPVTFVTSKASSFATMTLTTLTY
jgi:hypothetical protein